MEGQSHRAAYVKQELRDLAKEAELGGVRVQQTVHEVSRRGIDAVIPAPLTLPTARVVLEGEATSTPLGYLQVRPAAHQECG